MSYNLKRLIFQISESGQQYINYTSVSEGWIDMLYDRNGSYVCQRDNYAGTTTCTAEGEWISIPEKFRCTYEIEWEKSNSGITAAVLDNWNHKTKPKLIGTFVSTYPYDNQKTEVENLTPNDGWYLFFGSNEDAKSRIKISDWNAKSFEEQAAHLGDSISDPELNKEKEPEKPSAVGAAGTAQTGVLAGIKNLFSSTTPEAKTNRLWLMLAGVITVVAGVAVWAYRRYRRTKRYAEKAALKYGKYSQTVVDSVT